MPDAMLEYLIFFISLAGLYIGAKLLTDSASSMARAAGVSEFVIGATVVAFGTSLPELASSISAMRSGHPGIVVGNVLGSNVANIGLVLGLAAVFYPIYVRRQITDTDVPVLLASAAANLVVFLDLRVTGMEGIVLVLMYLAFIFHEISSKAGPDHKDPAKFDPRHVLGFLLGMVFLYFAARYLISSAMDISVSLNISETMVAFFLIALGTSLPELATSLIAAGNGQGDVAMGNVLGSNSFNSLVVLGCSSLSGVVSADIGFLIPGLSVMILLSIILGFMSLNSTITRLEGSLLLLLYGAAAINLL